MFACHIYHNNLNNDCTRPSFVVIANQNRLKYNSFKVFKQPNFIFLMYLTASLSRLLWIHREKEH